MTPKERSEELVNKFLDVETEGHDEDGYFETTIGWNAAKQCALIAVDEMLMNAGFIWGGRDIETGLTARDSFRQYWQQVKTEIQSL